MLDARISRRASALRLIDIANCPKKHEHPASNIEPSLVKPLHPLAEIAARIARADGEGVRLTHSVNGEPVLLADDSKKSIDPVVAVHRALSEPLNYPPLAAGIVPGDRVAIAVDA